MSEPPHRKYPRRRTLLRCARKGEIRNLDSARKPIPDPAWEPDKVQYSEAEYVQALRPGSADPGWLTHC